MAGLWKSRNGLFNDCNAGMKIRQLTCVGMHIQQKIMEGDNASRHRRALLLPGANSKKAGSILLSFSRCLASSS